MKRNAVVIIILAVVLLCVGFGVAWHNRGPGKSDFIQESRVSELPEGTQDLDTEAVDGDNEEDSSEQAGTEDSRREGRNPAGQGKPQDKFPAYIRLTKKQQNALRSYRKSGAVIMKRYCELPEAPGSLPAYKCVPVSIDEASEKKAVFSLLKKECSDNPIQAEYTPEILPGDFLAQESPDLDTMAQHCSEEQPYTLIFPEDTEGFLFNKYYYDTRISPGKCPQLTPQSAGKRVGKLSRRLVRTLELGCGVAGRKDWQMEGHISNQESDGILYKNKVQEGYYTMQVPLTLGSYPLSTAFGQNPDGGRVQFPVSIEISYAQTGLAAVYGLLECSFQKSGKEYAGLIPAQKAVQSVKRFLAKKGTDAVVGISGIRLSYAVVADEEKEEKRQVKPVWELYGFKQSIGGGKCRYLVDARTGGVYCEELAE